MRTVPQVDTRPFEVFLDLDGVFADFEGFFFELTNKRIHEVEKRELWKVVNAHPHFFYSLKLMPEAEVLWDYCRQYRPTFLTGMPMSRGPFGGREQKLKWVAEKFGEEWTVHVVPKKQKQQWSGPNKVLIDDTRSNIDEWTVKGGLAVYHTGDVWKTIDKLEELRKAY